jgi:hypothetical protein
MKTPVAAGLAVGIAFGVLFSTIKLSSGVGNVDGAVITMERTMCFGTCTTHSLAIYGNGTVNYEGFAFVAVTGSHTYQISKEKVEQLVREFHRINYFSLEDRYEEPVTDLPSTTTPITIGGMAKSVYRYGFEPEKLVQVENRI